MLLNYFFIDGSALTAQIRVLRKKDRSFENRRLDASKFIAHLSANLPELGSEEFKRAVFYFPQGDQVAIEEYLVIPDFNKPGEVRDIHFKYCGYKLKGWRNSRRGSKPTFPLNGKIAFQKVRRA